MSDRVKELLATVPAGLVAARVLRAGVIDGNAVKPDDLVAVPTDEAAGLVADGAIDTAEAAVAYAASLVVPPASAEPALEAADAATDAAKA